jgi:hypothetical protein
MTPASPNPEVNSMQTCRAKSRYDLLLGRESSAIVSADLKLMASLPLLVFIVRFGSPYRGQLVCGLSNCSSKTTGQEGLLVAGDGTATKEQSSMNKRTNSILRNRWRLSSNDVSKVNYSVPPVVVLMI